MSVAWLWWDDKCRWPKIIQAVDEAWTHDRMIEEYKERVEWIYENVENPERHCRWTLYQDDMKFCFRHEQDLLIFTLRWL